MWEIEIGNREKPVKSVSIMRVGGGEKTPPPKKKKVSMSSFLLETF